MPNPKFPGMFPIISTYEQSILRRYPQRSRFYLGLQRGKTLLSGIVTGSPAPHATLISLSSVVGSQVPRGATVFIGSAAGLSDLGVIYAFSYNPSVLFIGINGLSLNNGNFVTVSSIFRLWALDPADPNIYDSLTHLPPMPILGSMRAGFTGEPINFVSHRSYSPLSLPIVSTVWDFNGGIIQRNPFYAATINSVGSPAFPIQVAFPAAGEYIVSCKKTDSMGGATTCYRTVLVYDRSSANAPWLVGGGRSSPYQNFVINRLEGSYSGGWKLSGTLYDALDLAALPDMSQLVLWAEDYYAGVKRSLGGRPGQPEIIFTGFITKLNQNFQPGERGAVTIDFEAESSETLLRLLESPAYTFISLPSNSADLTQWVPALSIPTAIVTIVRFRTTLLNLVDVFVDDGNANYYGQITGVFSVYVGQGYTSAPTVSFTLPPGGTGSGAAATAVVGNLSGFQCVLSFIVTNPGSNYNLPPLVVLTGGGYSLIATAVASLDRVVSHIDTVAANHQHLFDQQLLRAMFGALSISRTGELYMERNEQMRLGQDATQLSPALLTFEPADWKDDLIPTAEPIRQISQVILEGFTPVLDAVSATYPLLIFTFGEIARLRDYLVVDSADAQIQAIQYYFWKSIQLTQIVIRAANYRVLEPASQDACLINLGSRNNLKGRAYNWGAPPNNKRFICRKANLTIDPAGYVLSEYTLEEAVYSPFASPIADVSSSGGVASSLTDYNPCPLGTTWDAKAKACVSNFICPIGKVWDPDAGACVVEGLAATIAPPLPGIGSGAYGANGVGPSGSDVWHSNMYVVTNNGIYKTTNFTPSGGQPVYVPWNTGFPTSGSFLPLIQAEADGYNPRTLYAVFGFGSGVDSSLWILINGVLPWVKLTDAFTLGSTVGQGAPDCYISAIDTSRVFGPGYINLVLSGLGPQQRQMFFFASYDYGQTWEIKSNVPIETSAWAASLSAGQIVSFAYTQPFGNYTSRGRAGSPATASYIYLLFSGANNVSSPSWGLAYSSDKGLSWSVAPYSVNHGSDLSKAQLVIDPVDERYVWIVNAGGNILKSTGAVGVSALTSVGAGALVLSAFSPAQEMSNPVYDPATIPVSILRCMVTGSPDVLYETLNGGTSFSTFNAIGLPNVSPFPFGIMTVPGAPQKLFAFTGAARTVTTHALFVSTDKINWVARDGADITAGTVNGIPFNVTIMKLIPDWTQA